MMRTTTTNVDAVDVLRCPQCNEPVWDMPRGHKLAKCWGCMLAFDTMDDDDDDDDTTTTNAPPHGDA